MSVKWTGLLIAVCVIALDQWSKAWVLAHLVPYSPLHLTSFLNIMLAFNSGAAFSILSGPQLWHTWFFIIFSSTISLYLVFWLGNLKSNQGVLAVAISLILGGAVSNLYDRLTIGQVVDFIDVFYRFHHWPVFNVADSAICIGAVMLCFCEVKFPFKRSQ
ncbi:MAG: signal peptidase II [Gammaproteobacteria bacterium]|nr:signal peptidase II [Gammaproteobacteria bacterium]